MQSILVLLRVTLARLLYWVSGVGMKLVGWSHAHLTRCDRLRIGVSRLGQKLHRNYCIKCRVFLNNNPDHHPDNWHTVCRSCWEKEGFFTREELGELFEDDE